MSAALECLDDAISTNPGLDDEPPSGRGKIPVAPLVIEPAVISVTFTSSPCVPPQLVNVVPEPTPVVMETNLSPSPTALDTTPTKTPIVCDSVIASVVAIQATPSAVALPVGTAMTNTSPPPTSPSSSTTASTPSPVQTPTHRSGDAQFVMMEIQELEEEPVSGARVHSGRSYAGHVRI